MSKKEKYTFTYLLENDAFIAWIHSNKNDGFWSKEQKKIKNEEFIQFEKAVKTLNKFYTLPVDEIETKQSINSINQEFDRLLSAAAKKKKVIKIPAILKYAAAVILLVSISVVLKFSLHANSFDENLIKTTYNTSDVLLQTPNLTYYKISRNTPRNWVTENGVSIEINNTNIHFSTTKDIPLSQQEKYKIIVPKGKKYNVTFIDGTLVELNSNSTLTFSTATNSSERKVALTGAAFFDVTPNKNRPFIVQSSDLKIKVLGTEFNVSNYEKNEYTSTTLIEGSIKVSNPQGENTTIVPGEQVKLFHNQNAIIVSKADPQKKTSRIASRMDFENETLKTILLN